jgi:hypothetical protein
MDEYEVLGRCNKTELVQLLYETHGIRAHKGLPKSLLIETLVTGRVQQACVNPFDYERDTIIQFINKHRSKLEDQLSIKCHAECYKHTDVQTLVCYINSRSVIEEDAGE